MTTRLKWMTAAALLAGGAWFVVRPGGAETASDPPAPTRRTQTSAEGSRVVAEVLTPAAQALRERGIAATNFLPADFDGRPPPEPPLSPDEAELVRIFRKGSRARTAETTVFFGPGPKHGSIDLEPPGEHR